MTQLLTTFVLTSAILTSGQIGGGSATFGAQRTSAADAARANELAKRNAGRDEGGRYIDAAVLMNVNADEYVAVFGISQEGKTLDEAQRKMEEALRTFTSGLEQLKISSRDFSVDFVSQNRVYGFEGAGGNVVREVVVGYEVKKNVSIRFVDKSKLDAITAAGGKAGVFDLVKVDYVLKNTDAIRTRLLEEAARIIKRKTEEQERFLDFKIGQITHVYPAQFSTYFPSELYDFYVAQESEELVGYRENQIVQRARKPRTFYFNGLSGKDFDSVINPSIVEPTAQCTVYVRVRY